jgi:hypothetical protein
MTRRTIGLLVVVLASILAAPADLEAADDRDDVPADVALVSLQGAGADASSPLVLEPTAQSAGQADPLRRGIASSLYVADELVDCALRCLLGSGHRSA